MVERQIEEIAITGAAGFIGTALRKKLSQEYKVQGYDNFSNPSIKQEKAENVQSINVRDFEKLEEKAGNIDLFIHLAAVSSVSKCRKNPDEAVRNNVETTSSVAKLCRRNQIPLIFASSFQVFGSLREEKLSRKTKKKPETVYGCTKRLGEKIIEQKSKNSFTALNLLISNVYGSYRFREETVRKNNVVELFIKNAKQGKDIEVHRPIETKNFIHVEDLVKLINKAIKRLDKLEGFEEILASPEKNLSLKELARIVKEISEEENGKIPDILETKPSKVQKTLTKNYTIENSHMKRLLDFKPEKKLDKYIRRRIVGGI